MFRGASSLNMDSKGRLGVPTKYRDPLRERCAGKLVLTVNNTRERCLWLYPYDEWEQVERKVVDLPSFDASAQALKRFLIGYATDCELDSAGRVRVSAPLRERAIKLIRSYFLISRTMGRKFFFPRLRGVLRYLPFRNSANRQPTIYSSITSSSFRKL